MRLRVFKSRVNNKQLIATPAYRAAQAKKLGEYLGCPERDEPNRIPLDLPPQLKELEKLMSQ
jgi:hypothetical protein